MNINGASSLYGANASWMNPASAMNNQRLMNALSSNKKLSSVAKVGKQLSASASLFMKDYQSKMTTMMASANALRGDNESGIANKFTAVSADGSIASVRSAPKNMQVEARYDIEVTQTAAAQSNVSNGATSFDAATASGEITIAGATGSVSFQIGAPDGQTNRDLLTELATQINQSGVGVNASVVEKDGKSSLELASNKTGADNGFAVSGEFAAQTGLDTVKTTAQNAIFSVSKDGGMALNRESATNDVAIGNLSVTLNGAGKTYIIVGPDNEKLTDAVETMIKDYNNALTFLTENQDRGVGVLQQMKKMVLPPTSLKSMDKIGISVNVDGTYSLDKKEFGKALAKDPKLVRDVISGSSGMAQGVFQDAQSGLKTPSSSLVSSEKKATQFNAAQQDPINFMSAYSKSGAYNMMNYFAVGAMMNFNA